MKTTSMTNKKHGKRFQQTTGRGILWFIGGMVLLPLSLMVWAIFAGIAICYGEDMPWEL